MAVGNKKAAIRFAKIGWQGFRSGVLLMAVADLLVLADLKAHTDCSRSARLMKYYQFGVNVFGIDPKLAPMGVAKKRLGLAI